MYFDNEAFKVRYEKVSFQESTVAAKTPGNLFVTNFRVIFEPDDRVKSKISLEYTNLSMLKYNTKNPRMALLVSQANKQHIFELGDEEDLNAFKSIMRLYYNSETKTALASSMVKDHLECLPMTKVKRSARGEVSFSKGTNRAFDGFKSFHIEEGETPSVEKMRTIFSVFPVLEVSYKEYISAGKKDFWPLYRSNFCLKSVGSMDQDFLRYSHQEGKEELEEKKKTLESEAIQAPSEFNIFSNNFEFDRSKFVSHTSSSLEFSENSIGKADNEVHKRFEEKRSLASGWCWLNNLSKNSLASRSTNSSSNNRNRNSNSNSTAQASGDDELGVLNTQNAPLNQPLVLSMPAMKRSAQAISTDNSNSNNDSHNIGGSNSPPAFGVKRPSNASSVEDPVKLYTAMGFADLCSSLRTSAPSSKLWRDLLSADLQESLSSGTSSSSGGSTTVDTENNKEFLDFLTKEKYYENLFKFWDYVSEGKVEGTRRQEIEQCLHRLREIESVIRDKKRDPRMAKIDIVFVRILEPIAQANRVWDCIKAMYALRD